MKKITILATHLNYGGIEKYISYLCKMFEKDYDVEVISTYKYNDIPAFDFSKKIRITYLTSDFPDRVSLKSLLKNHSYLKSIKEILRRAKLNIMAYHMNKKIVKRLNSDYVITTRLFHNKIVNKYLNNSRIVKIATEHNYHNNNQKYIKRVVGSTTNFDYFIHCTDELFDYYKPLIKGPKNIKIYNPVYIDNNFKSDLKNLNIISVGRLSDEKGYLDLIEIMRLLKQINNKIKLTICGDGHQRIIIEKKIAEYDLINNVNITGFIKGMELVNKYTNSSLYVLPSKSEAFGLVLLEAMHYGLPCIAFDSASGARNLLKDDIGILIKNRNIEEMANKIDELLRSKYLLKKYSNSSLECVKRYSLDRIYKDWKNILK